jgi:hypothetical protein
VALATVAAIGGQQWLTPRGTGITAGAMTPGKPGKMKTAAQADGRDQVIMRLWWTPTLGAPASVQWSTGDRTTTADVPTAPVSTPFERRSMVPPGTKVVLGATWTKKLPTPAGWELWEAGKLVRHGTERGGFTVVYVTVGA